MKIKRLLKEFPISLLSGSKEVEITGLCGHSKFVAPGNLFIAKRGRQADGAHYCQEAVAAGAAAILTDLPDPSLKVPQLIVEDVHAIEARLASFFYGFPSSKLFTIGVTGTNGKTTTAHLIHHLIGGGLLGTVSYVVKDYRYEAQLTTPDCLTLQKMLHKMVCEDCSSVVMEATSIGIDQGRIDGVDFDLAIFTNLSQDHLDYHGTMENYAAAKAKLFERLDKEAFALVPVGEKRMIRNCPAKILTYGFDSGDFQVSEVNFRPECTEFTFEGSRFTLPLIGRYNLLNALAALAAARLFGVEVDRLTFDAFPSIPGRLERVGEQVFVDFAHTPDALATVLSNLRKVTKGKLIVVFGAGGDRDREKRPQMGEAAACFADTVILTADNPRNEDPLSICREIAVSCSEAVIEVDRRKAIEKAIGLASMGDTILIAGKGHETQQIFKQKSVPFDDREVAREILEKRHF